MAHVPLCLHATLITINVYDHDKAPDVAQVAERFHKTPASVSSTIAGMTAHACNTPETGRREGRS